MSTWISGVCLTYSVTAYFYIFQNTYVENVKSVDLKVSSSYEQLDKRKFRRVSRWITIVFRIYPQQSLDVCSFNSINAITVKVFHSGHKYEDNGGAKSQTTPQRLLKNSQLQRSVSCVFVLFLSLASI